MTTTPSTASGTVARVARLLQVLAETEGPTSLSTIAERMGLPPSTTHRLLNLLAEQGFVERDPPTKTYRVGLELFRIGALVASNMKLTEVAEPFMQAMVAKSDEACMLSLHESTTHSFVIAKVLYGSHPVRYHVDLYQRSSLLWGAPGRGILAFLGESEIAHAIEQDQQRSSPRPSRNLATVQHDLELTRSRGYAYTRGQNVTGAVGISAPIFDPRRVVGALCITIPESRFESSKVDLLAQSLIDQANQLSSALGK